MSNDAGMRRGRTPFQHVEPPRIVGKMHADMVGDEIEDQAEVVLLAAPALRRAKPASPPSSGLSLV